MCGILGCLSLDGRPAPAAIVDSLVPMLAHRGPDDTGLTDGQLASFGHTRLSILGPAEEVARQPVSARQGMLTFNGEIYNFREIVQYLASDGIRVSGRSDTEALFAALCHWGVRKTLDRIDGMFAFAFFDAVSNTLFLVRDRLGEKPIYWSERNGRFWFASEIKVIVAAGDIEPEPNLDRLDEYLHTAKISGADTIFRHVQELEPGHLLERKLTSSSPWISGYWSLFDRARDGYERKHTNTEFNEQFRRAVSSRMISDTPVGVLLSGGIDSNALVDTILREGATQNLTLFFADNENRAYSEREDVDIFLDQMSHSFPDITLDFRPVKTDYADYTDHLLKLAWHYDEPIQFFNSPLLLGLCEAARKENIKVLVSGEGSDELLYGYERFSRTRGDIELCDDRESALDILYFGGGIENARIISDLAQVPPDAKCGTAAWQWLDANLGVFELDRLQLLFSQRHRLQMLLQRQDRVGMASSVEIRVPFLAPEFVEWANQLPISELFDPETKTTKKVLRSAMNGRLPKRILSKRKDGFPSDVMDWLREDRMKRDVSDLVYAEDSFCSTYLDRKILRNIVEGHFDRGQWRDYLIWNLYSLELWHRSAKRYVRAGTTSPEIGHA